MFRLNVIAFLLIFQLFAVVFCESSVKQCSLFSLSDNTKESCPPFAICTQTDTATSLGECICPKEKFIFNVVYKSDDDYCVPNPNKTTATTTTPQKQSSSTIDEDAPQIVPRRPPSSHHVIGGILIPIFIVFIVIGIVYASIRFRITQRIREALFARRHRPSYQDVMMGTDFDDPPLI